MSDETALTSGRWHHARAQRRNTNPSPNRLDELLEALSAPIYATDLDGAVTYYNQAAAEFSGHRLELGRDHSQLGWQLCRLDGAPLSRDQWPMTIALREGRETRGPAVVAERPNGSRVTLFPHASPLRNGVGQIVGSVNMLVEIAECSDLQMQERLLLDEVNHRIKNNLQMLCALLESARRETSSEEARAVLSDASRRVSAMGAAQHVLYVAGNSTDFSAEDFLRSVCANASINFGKNVTIRRELASTNLPNHAAMPLALILNELLTNAVKYGANERGEVIIRVGLVKNERSYELYVEDEGPGFDFEKARKRSSGLGLVMALAQQLNGILTVERILGSRCTVKFEDKGKGMGQALRTMESNPRMQATIK
jgi:two-component sensor histidine kinase